MRDKEDMTHLCLCVDMMSSVDAVAYQTKGARMVIGYEALSRLMESCGPLLDALC